MSRIREALAEAAARLGDVSDSARLDAELLMAHALGVNREAMLLSLLDDPAPAGFAALIERRLAHEPVAYITGIRDFWTIALRVGPGVLIPRADSETLIEAAVAHFAGRAPQRILDLGTGPGTLLLAALDQWPGASGVGVDVSEQALDYARANAKALGLANRATFRIGDWGDGIDETFDLVLANPPYIGTEEMVGEDVRRHEPHGALFAGADGLDAYRVLVPQLSRLRAEGGIAVVEIGAGQAEPVSALMRAAGLTPVLHRDLAGRPRALTAG